VHHGVAHPASAKRSTLEVADIVRRFGPAFLRTHAIPAERRAVLLAIERCRTAELGGHLEVCSACGFEQPAYNSCRNRHCPKCQSLAQAKWVAKRLGSMLPVHAFHVVFTMPAELRAITQANRSLIFNLLFATASSTLLTLGRDPEHLGATLGITMVLHTWSRTLAFHPHVHAIVTGGGLSLDGERWVPASPKYLLPVQVMSPLFRGTFLAKLERLIQHKRIRVPEDFDWPSLRDSLYQTDWVVYAKRPFGGAEQVFRYLGRYTHRVGISNQRLLSITDTHVTFRTKEGESVTLTGDQFLLRWTQHVLPSGFVKIRHFGLMASANVATRLARARALLQPKSTPDAARSSTWQDALDDWRRLMLELTGIDVELCLRCGQRTLVRRPLPLPPCRAPPGAP
jgi:hypothetical protein